MQLFGSLALTNAFFADPKASALGAFGICIAVHNYTKSAAPATLLDLVRIVASQHFDCLLVQALTHILAGEVDRDTLAFSVLDNHIQWQYELNHSVFENVDWFRIEVNVQGKQLPAAAVTVRSLNIPKSFWDDLAFDAKYQAKAWLFCWHSLSFA